MTWGARTRTGRLPASLGLALALTLLLASCAQVRSQRWADEVTVTEIVLLSQHGVPPEKIIAKMRRAGTIYLLSDEQYANLREQGVTPVVIEYMQKSFREAVEQHPRLADDDHLHCFTLGFDGVWYAGGPWGFHPECFEADAG